MKIPQPVATAFSALLRLPPPPDPPPGDQASAVVFRASPKFLKYRTTLWGLAAAPLLVGGALPLALTTLAASGHTPPPKHLTLGAVALALAVGTVLVWWLLIRLDYAWRWYVVTDRSLRVREGIWNVREMTVTFANVQNLSIEQGPLERLFGISNVRVDTAGGGAVATQLKAGHAGLLPNLHTARMRGLDNAEFVRTAIQQRLRGRADAGLGDPEDQARHPQSPVPVTPDALWAAPALIEEAPAPHPAARRFESGHATATP